MDEHRLAKKSDGTAPSRATGLLGLWLALCGASCGGPGGAEGSPSISPLAPVFVDEAPAAGVRFVHFNGMTGKLYLPEMMGPGAALLDYDNDGDLDLFVVQGSALDLGGAGSRLPSDTDGDRLFRNDSTGGSLVFRDVTAESRLRSEGYGIGVATGDFDNDGWVDLYVTNVGPNRLLRNGGDGTFTDVTAATGTGDPGFGVSAAFLDFDRDGWLDLFLGNYVNFDLAQHEPCHGAGGRVDYCGPLAFDPQPNRLWRNLGGGAFEDVSVASGIASQAGGALGVVASDLDGDGWIDIYVANDERPNLLWVNQGDGTFQNRAMLAGCSVNEEGLAESSMGVDAADIDGDGNDDLFMTHLKQQTNTLYRNSGDGFWEDWTSESGLGRASWRSTGFGTAFLDFDNDGWLDIFVANGAVRIVEALAARGDPHPLGQPNQLFRNLGDGRFEDFTPWAGAAFGLLEVSRGAAFGDVDNDGDTDAVLLNNAGPLRLLINRIGQDSHWLGLRLVGERVDRDMLGARAAVLRPGSPPLWRRVRSAASYASANDPRVLFGLGSVDAPVAVLVRWPDARLEKWTDIRIDRYLTLRQGTGQTAQ